MQRRLCTCHPRSLFLFQQKEKRQGGRVVRKGGLDPYPGLQHAELDPKQSLAACGKQFFLPKPGLHNVPCPGLRASSCHDIL